MVRSTRLADLLLLAALAPIGVLPAQRPEQLRVGIQPVRDSLHNINPAVVVRADSSHWKAGFVFGSIVGALFVASVAGGYGAELTPRFVVVSVMGGVLIGGVPGALIGGLFPKR
jgi:hypothetical protein